MYMLLFSFAMPSFSLRSTSASSPLLIRSYEWEENGTYIGGTREVHRMYKLKISYSYSTSQMIFTN